MGKNLEHMLETTKSRLPITSIAGFRRPLDPHESAYIASITNVFVRNDIPILPSWKHH